MKALTPTVRAYRFTPVLTGREPRNARTGYAAGMSAKLSTLRIAPRPFIMSRISKRVLYRSAGYSITGNTAGECEGAPRLRSARACRMLRSGTADGLRQPRWQSPPPPTQFQFPGLTLAIPCRFTGPNRSTGGATTTGRTSATIAAIVTLTTIPTTTAATMHSRRITNGRIIHIGPTAGGLTTDRAFPSSSVSDAGRLSGCHGPRRRRGPTCVRVSSP
jgi:hypothetical protein